ncbi:MAG: hypothetical protein JXA75_04275 [Candidatus Thermoplasmatota archaeon]|nr:hypothetical protein [Candidatus Thermoplasmatota archaeon]
MTQMRREVMVLSVVLFFFFQSITPTSSTPIARDHEQASIEDITLQDDAFHGRGKLPFIEWWYFDAKLDNGYSVVFGVHVLNLFARGIVSTRLTVYEQGCLIIENYERFSFRDFSASSDYPSVFIEGNQVILGSYDALEHCFIYDVTIEFFECSMSLHFVGRTDGWKRQQQTGDWWAVILPRADVSGTITVGTTTLNVTGTGYHDHNWGVGPQVIFHFGWFWGTCSSLNYTVTWAEIRTTRITQIPLVVVNINDDGYLDIPSETIWFSTHNMSLDHLRWVPRFFNIETVTEHVFLVINMEVLKVDYTEMFGFIHYWRFHVRCSGTILVDGHVETVDGVFVMEYLRFR